MHDMLSNARRLAAASAESSSSNGGDGNSSSSCSSKVMSVAEVMEEQMMAMLAPALLRRSPHPSTTRTTSIARSTIGAALGIANYILVTFKSSIFIVTLNVSLI